MLLQAKSTDAQQTTTTGEGGEPREAGEAGGGGGGGEAVSSEDVKPKEKDKKVDATQQEQSTATGSAQGTQVKPAVGNGRNRLSRCSHVALEIHVA